MALRSEGTVHAFVTNACYKLGMHDIPGRSVHSGMTGLANLKGFIMFTGLHGHIGMSIAREQNIHERLQGVMVIPE